MKNLCDKVPEEFRPEIKAEIMTIRDAAGYEQGKQRAYEFIEKYKDKFPSLIKIFKEDLDALLNHLKLPFRHRMYIRTTNLVERSFEEERRRKNNSLFFDREISLKISFFSAYQGSQKMA